MPPYKSDAQRKYFHYLESKGKIPKKTVDEFDRASRGADLPEHVGMYLGGDIPDYPDGVGSKGENVSSGEPHTAQYYEEEHPQSYEDGDDEMEHVFRAFSGGQVPDYSHHPNSLAVHGEGEPSGPWLAEDEALHLGDDEGEGSASAGHPQKGERQPFAKGGFAKALRKKMAYGGRC